MKKLFLLVILLLLNNTIIAQENKFSLELNYPVPLTNSGLTDYSGIISGSFKYRFKEKEHFIYGLSYTFDNTKGSLLFASNDLKENYYYHHLNFYTELKVDGIKKLHPFASFGYTHLSYDYEYMVLMGAGLYDIKKAKRNSNGFNFELGFQYDLTANLFTQFHHQYVREFYKDEYTNELTGYNYNQLKVGFGLRF